MNGKNFVRETGLLVATTVGAGVFALPYVFRESGWIVGVIYLFGSSAVIITIHSLYWKVLDRVGRGEHLLGLTKMYCGKAGFYSAFFVIVGGLVASLVVYLILGGQFVRLVFPGVGTTASVVVFWILSSLPFVLGLRRLIGLEVLGAILMGLIIFFIFFMVWPPKFPEGPALNLQNFFFPFGPILFALAGWTAIEPMYNLHAAHKKEKSFQPILALATGTLAAAILYLLFVIGILGSAAEVTPNTISGLTNWPAWRLGLLGALGIFGIWTSYIPVGLEIRNSLEKDLNWNMGLGFSIVVFLPIILIFSGFNNFLSAVAVAGGIFLSLQHVFIVFIGKRALVLSRARAYFVDILILVFTLAAVYSAAQFFN